MMARFPMTAAAAALDFAFNQETDADSGADGDHRQTRRTTAGPNPPLAERGHVSIVVDGHRCAGKGFFERRNDIGGRPTVQGVGVGHDTRGDIDRTGDADAQRKRLSRCESVVFANLTNQIGHDFHNYTRATMRESRRRDSMQQLTRRGDRAYANVRSADINTDPAHSTLVT